MKVIDKRTERNNDWHIGDVICYWNKPDEKYYGLICEIKLPTDSGFGVTTLIIPVSRLIYIKEVYTTVDQDGNEVSQ
ncbi:MAG: hypothetical protein SPI82_00155 [Lactobacillus johnsonii]|nr:hypothetical protein [Lactobacillus johnsonii]